MKIAAVVKNSGTDHQASISTNGRARSLPVPAKASGPGSAVNGGEFLMLALATCFLNDVYREAARLGITVWAVEVEVMAHFPGVGLAATDIRYRADVSSPASADAIAELLRQTDAVAEVHNTIRSGTPVVFVDGPSDEC